MKIHITGTTRGLGKAIKEYAELRGWHVTAFDKPIYDLERNVGSFVRADFDVYVNNAYHAWTQTELLYKLWELNWNRNCRIINIGSVCSDQLYDRVYPYAIHKMALAEACRQLQQIDARCLVTHVKLGRMETEMVAHRTGPKMDTAQVAKEIGHVIDMPYGYAMKEITLDNLYLPS